MKKTTSILLALAMVFALAVPAFADNDMSAPGNSSSVPVRLTAAPATFSVTVPTVMAISITAGGDAVCASNLSITNNGSGPVRVTGFDITGTDGWGLVGWDTDFSSVPVNTRQFAFSIMGRGVSSSGIGDVSGFSSIPGGGSEAVVYDAKFPGITSAISSTQIAGAVFTITWDSAD